MTEPIVISLHSDHPHPDSHRHQRTLVLNSKPKEQLTDELRKLYKSSIFPEINRELKPIFNSDLKGETFTIEAYMSGKSTKRLRPTIFLMGGDSKTRETAIKAIKKSSLLDKYPDWHVTHASKFPNLSETCQESLLPDDFEFFSMSGTATWHDEGISPGVAMEVYFDLRPYSDPLKRLPSRGLAIFIKQPSGLRMATANVVKLGDRAFLQTVYHAFHPGSYQREPSEYHSAQKQGELLTLIGRLLVWSVDRDWALIQILEQNINNVISRDSNEDEEENCIFRRAGRPSNSYTNTYTWTATSGKLEVTLSETTMFMKLPYSSSFQEVHRVHLSTGSWSNGDSGAVVIDVATGLTFGHVLGGSQSQGVGFIVAADEVVNEFQELNYSSHLHDNPTITQRARTSDHPGSSDIVVESVVETDTVIGPDRINDSPGSASSPFSGIKTPELTNLTKTLSAQESIRAAKRPYQESNLTDQSELRDHVEDMNMDHHRQMRLGKGVTVITQAGPYSKPDHINDSPRRTSSPLGIETPDSINPTTTLSAKEPIRAPERPYQDSNLTDLSELREHIEDTNIHRRNKLWLEKGATVITQVGSYSNALYEASAAGEEMVVKRLLSKGADANAEGGYYGNALQAASVRGNEQIIKLLLDAGAEINARGGHYGNSLQAALYKGNKKVTTLLLDAGADANIPGGYYGNALQLALVGGYKHMVELLLEMGANVNIQGGYYGNALQAASYKGDEEMIKLLLNKGADVNAQGGYYGTALQAASAEGHKQVVKLLLDAGAKTDLEGGHYNNAVVAALERGHEQVVGLLLDNDTDVNTPGG